MWLVMDLVGLRGFCEWKERISHLISLMKMKIISLLLKFFVLSFQGQIVGSLMDQASQGF